MADAQPRRIVVTGAAGEIGAYLTRTFADAGWRVTGVDRKEPAKGADARVTFRRCDLADGAETTTVLDELASALGPADALVNCAGVIANAPLVSLADGAWKTHDFALWQEVIAGSLTSAFHATAVTVRQMIAARRQGVVVNISSICAQGNAGQAAYSAAKAGLDGLTKALGKELGPLGIRVVGLAPGYFDTESTRSHVAPARLAKITSAVPLRRLGRLDEIAGAVRFIVDTPYVNGTIVALDGGLVV